MVKVNETGTVEGTNFELLLEINKDITEICSTLHDMHNNLNTKDWVELKNFWCEMKELKAKMQDFEKDWENSKRRK
jgi:hypothetical protein